MGFGPTNVAHIPPLKGWHSRDSLCYGAGARVAYITAKAKKKEKPAAPQGGREGAEVSRSMNRSSVEKFRTKTEDNLPGHGASSELQLYLTASVFEP